MAPLYNYQCGCGVLFEASNSIVKYKDPKPCPNCGEDAPRAMPDTVAGHFNVEVTGPGPQNSGIHDLDTHIDRVIGKSADQGREIHRQRVADKRALMEATGAAGQDLSRNPDNTYRVLSPEERGVHERSQAIHIKAGTALKKNK